jgi:hypothetical protein
MEGWEMQIPRGARGEGSGTEVWLKLVNDGDRAVVAFLGEPFGREVVFEGNRYVACTAAHQAAGAEVKFRLGVNVAVLAGPVVKVFEMGVATFRDVVALRAKLGFDTWAFEVRREGKPKDQTTRYHVLPERPLTEAERRWLVTATRHDLRALYARDAARPGGSAPAAGAPPPRPAGATAPAAKRTISDEVAHALVAELRRLTGEGVQAWLKHCGIGRVRELPLDRVPDARAFLALLVKEQGGAVAPPPSPDPFA